MHRISEKRLLNKIEPLNKLLESRFGLRVSMSSIDNLADIRENYLDKRSDRINTLGEARAFTDENYAKAYLISEAIGIILREIAPKRIKRKSPK